MRHITVAEVMAGIIEPQPPVPPVGVNDRVFDKADPRQVGKVHGILRDVALVQWGWNGMFSLLAVETLRRIP